MAAEQGATKLLNAAEELVETLDNLCACLKHIDEKYMQEGKTESGKVIDKTSCLYTKLKENLEAAQSLTDSIKREKWRLSRREMSIELRMGELQEYKSHMKKDMCDMNQTVEALSMRVIQLENALCEAQDIEERMMAERTALTKHSKESERQITNLEEKVAAAQEETKKLQLRRTDTVLRMQNEDLTNKMEVLLLENQRLKEIIRERDENDISKNTPKLTGAENASSEQNPELNTNTAALEHDKRTDDCQKAGSVVVRQSSTDPGKPDSTVTVNGHKQSDIVTKSTEVAYV